MIQLLGLAALAAAGLWALSEHEKTETKPTEAPPKPPAKPSKPAIVPRSGDKPACKRHDFSGGAMQCRVCGKQKVVLPCHAVKRGKDKAPRAVTAAKPALPDPAHLPPPAAPVPPEPVDKL